MLLRGHTDAVRAVVCVRNEYIISASFDQSIRVWSRDTGENIAVLNGHADRIYSLALRTDFSIVSGSKDCTVRVWPAVMWTNPATQSSMSALVLTGQDGVLSVACSRDDDIVASGGGESIYKVRIWSISKRTCLRVYSNHQASVWGVSFLPDSRLVSASQDNTICVWRVDTDTVTKTHELKDSIWSNVACLSNRYIVVGARQQIHIVDLENGDIVRTFTGHDGDVRCVLVVSPNGPIMASTSEDNTIRVWDISESIFSRSNLLVYHTCVWLATFNIEVDFSSSSSSKKNDEHQVGSSSPPPSSINNHHDQKHQNTHHHHQKFCTLL
jgi:WD40 repeat protein